MYGHFDDLCCSIVTTNKDHWKVETVEADVEAADAVEAEEVSGVRHLPTG